MNIITALIAEHRVLCRLFDQIEHTMTKPGSLSQLHFMASFVYDQLSRHGHMEENLVYVAFDHVLENTGQRTIFYQEHDEIHKCLYEALTVKRQMRARRLLSKALAIARIHFRHEETDVFPLIDQAMRCETLDQLGEAWLKQFTIEPVFTDVHLLPQFADNRLRA